MMDHKKKIISYNFYDPNFQFKKGIHLMNNADPFNFSRES